MKKIPNEIKQLDEKIKHLKLKEDNFRKQQRESEVSYATKTGFRVGTELFSGVLVGAAIGHVCDNFFETKPWLLIVFMLLGGAAGIVNVYRFAKSEERNIRSKDVV